MVIHSLIFSNYLDIPKQSSFEQHELQHVIFFLLKDVTLSNQNVPKKRHTIVLLDVS